MKEEYRVTERNEGLSKLYQKYKRISYVNTVHQFGRNIIKWARAKGYEIPLQRPPFDPRDSVINVARFYNEFVIKECIGSPMSTEIKYIGKFTVYEVNSVNGKERNSLDVHGNHIKVIDDVFSKSAKYIYEFAANYKKIKSELRPFIASCYNNRFASKYLPLVYGLHPHGKFYKLKR